MKPPTEQQKLDLAVLLGRQLAIKGMVDVLTVAVAQKPPGQLTEAQAAHYALAIVAAMQAFLDAEIDANRDAGLALERAVEKPALRVIEGGAVSQPAQQS